MTVQKDGLSAALSRSYRIEQELGQGGMATVYLAQDLKHRRKVALKVLKPELAAALGAERFLVEIATTANLRHPHILPLYDSGDADGTLFYVMPYIEGDSLRSRLDRESQLPLEDAMQIASDVADALSYAHSRGVIHRDIKPENILLENGRAVVADFGIAQAVTDSGGERLTQTGMVLGTPLYMCPEQSSGEPVDARSDLYALGCVTYEMLAGGPPFTGATALVVMARHALDPVPALRTARPGVPLPVAMAIERALAKTPSDRFPTVQAWRKALGQPTAAGSGVASGPSDSVVKSGAKRAAEGFWVAVMPFGYTGADPGVSALAEGLSEEIVTGLARFSYLRVMSRAATSRYAREAVDGQVAGEELGARYVIEGSIRQGGSRLRIAVRLIDASTGAHLWADTYDRPFSQDAIFALQDELVPQIVSTVADMQGVLPRTISEALRGSTPDQLTPYEAVLRSFGYFERVSVEEHGLALEGLELAVQRAPEHTDSQAMLAHLLVQGFAQGFAVHPETLRRGLAAAHRAVAGAPSNHLTHYALAQALFFHKDFPAFRTAADRVLALNPMDGNATSHLGMLVACAGDWERGCALAERATRLNPHHPGWYWFPLFFDQYRRKDYRGAVATALKINLPGHVYTSAVKAAAHAQLGDGEAARTALRHLLTLKPEAATTIREDLGRWFDPDLTEHLIDGLRKAGLDVAGEAAAEGESVSGLGEPAIAVVVLPFVNRSPDPGNEYFSDGLTEEIITDLSRLRALRVISRNSSMTLKGTTADTASIANQLGVTHIVTGSVRRAGDALRVTVELIEATSDSSLWSEKYSGTMADVFGIQEEIAQKIVAALEVRLTEAEAAEAKVVQRPIQDVVAWDCYLRARQELYAWTPDSMERAARLVDEALGIVGDNPLLLATQGQIAYMKVNLMFDPDERHLDRAAEYADRALAIAPDYYLGLFLRGIVAGLRGDTASAIRDTYRAHQLRPGDPNVLAEFCRFGNAAGVEVAAHVDELVRIDPLTPVTWLVVAFNRFQYGPIEKVIAPSRRCLSLAPGASMFPIFVARTFAEAGLREEAIELLDQAGRTLAGTLHGSWALFLRDAQAGAVEAAVSHMTPLLERGASMGDNIAIMVAEGYSLIGRNDDALKWIRIGMNRGFLHYHFLANHDPLLASVRSDPRFPDLMQEVKTRWEALGPSLPESLRLAPTPKEHP